MPGRVRPIDRGFIRLSDPVRAQVEYLARLAGVEPAQIVNFVLSEMLELDADAPAARLPRRSPSVRARPRPPADVIPITRKQGPARPRLPVLDAAETEHLRRRGSEIRQHAQVARARATKARSVAQDARSRTGNLLDAPRTAR